MFFFSGFWIVSQGILLFSKNIRGLAFVNSLWWSQVLLIFESTCNVRGTRKLLEVKKFSKNNKFFLLLQEANQIMLY